MTLGVQVGLGPRHIVLLGDPAPLPKKGAQSPIFGPCLYWQTAVCIRILLGTEVGLSLGDIVLDGDPAPPSLKGHTPTKFSAHVYCGQRAAWMKTTLVTEVDLRPGHMALDGDPAPPAKGAQQPLPSFRPMSIEAMVAHLSYR